MKVKVDRDLCESNAVCVGIAPDIFSLGDDDLAQVPAGDVPLHAKPLFVKSGVRV